MGQTSDDAAILHALNQLKLEMFAHFDSKLDSLQLSINSMQNSLTTLGDQVGALEFRVSSNQDNIVDLVKRVKTLEEKNTHLMEKVEDAENRSRSSNLRFLRVPEGSEGRDMLGFMRQLIPELLGKDHFPSSLEIERAHRTPGSSMSNPKAGPRPILVKFSHFQDKLKVLRLAREKQVLEYSGGRIHIYPDFSAGLQQKRRMFSPIKKRLRELDMRYALLYPAVLRIHADGKNHLFRSPEEAELFIRNVVMKSPSG